DALRRHTESRRIRLARAAQMVTAVREIEGHIPGPRNGFHAGRGFKLAVNLFAQRDGIYFRVGCRQIELQGVSGVEAWIEAQHVRQVADENERAEQQDY